MKLRVRALGLAVGIVWGLGIFAATICDAVRGKGRTLDTLNSFCLGYNISFGGAFVGLIWGLVYGFICGALIALLYNRLGETLYKSDRTTA